MTRIIPPPPAPVPIMRAGLPRPGAGAGVFAAVAGFVAAVLLIIHFVGRI